VRRGPEYAAALLDGLCSWMVRKGFKSVDDVRGMLSVPPHTDRSAYERAAYVSALRAANKPSYEPW
jgi:dihydroorotate dehydrogenase (fumarate)